MNKRGRPTEDKKNDSIRIRLNDDMRNYIINKSITTGKSISDIIRDYIKADMFNNKQHSN